MQRYPAIQSNNPMLWVFYVQYERNKTEIVFGTFFGRFPDRSKVRKMQLDARRADPNIKYTGYSSDVNDYKHYTWPPMIPKPEGLILDAEEDDDFAQLEKAGIIKKA